ncbi:MAG: phosphatidate cytidylyltransferase [Myxococcota bacterium]|jgi:phosphatidate cytidylyltransferase
MVKDLKQRLTLGSVLVTTVVALFVIDRDYFPAAAAVFTLLSLAAQQEFYSMLASDSNPGRKIWGGVMGAVILGGAWFAPELRFEMLFACVVVYLIFEVLSSQVENAAKRLAATLLPLLVVPLLLSYALLIRNVDPHGWGWMMMLVVACKAGDSSAYLVGSAIGKHKLIPKVSPNKSWEGAIASVLGAIIGAYCVARFAFDGELSTLMWLGAALVTNVGAQFGDLAESLLKRGCNSKDSASIIPAFGGTFDMVDSFLIAAPCLYFFLLITGVA